MDAFESLVGNILRADGYWVETEFKVPLTKRQKRSVGLASTPRWELDLVAYRARDNEVLIVECKSFLDSQGVLYEAFTGNKPTLSRKYKLFTNKKLWWLIRRALVKQLRIAGRCRARPKVRLWLVAGRIAPGGKKKLKAFFARRRWVFCDDDWLRDKLNTMSQSGYQNSQTAVVAKLFLKKPIRPAQRIVDSALPKSTARIDGRWSCMSSSSRPSSA